MKIRLDQVMRVYKSIFQTMSILFPNLVITYVVLLFVYGIWIDTPRETQK